MNVCVIFGGVSSEYSVSLVTSRNIINNLKKEKYQIHMIGITREGEWFLYEGSADNLPEDQWLEGKLTKAVISPDRKDRCILTADGRRIPVDVCYLGVHGQNAEDGTIQGLLELAGIPYTGPGVLSSALCMDKTMSKIILSAAGIPVADWICVKSPAEALERTSKRFTYPVFVKPAGAGSSLGASKVSSEAGLAAAVTEALQHDSKVLIEEYIKCREVECGIVGNEHPKAALLGEVVADTEFYTYEAKYVEGVASARIPANLTPAQAMEVCDIGIRAYQAMNCKGTCRIDFFIDDANNRVILNELNTLPGCTNSSMFPTLWEKTGTKFTDLLDEIIGYAMEGK